MSAGLPTPEAIARYLALEAPPRQVDLALVFGTRHPDPAHIAADLYRRGWCPLSS